jgi:hypothetical protein
MEENKIDIAEEEDRRTWKSCCFRIDRDASVFFSVYVIIIAVIGFCFYQLVHLHDCEAQSAYLGVLTMILGVLLPQPKLKK